MGVAQNEQVQDSRTSAGALLESRQAALAVAYRVLGAHGFQNGKAGYLAVRDVERSTCFWTLPRTVPYSLASVSNLVLVDESGHVIFGDEPINPAGAMIHSAICSKRPDVVSSCHMHGTFGMAVAATGRGLRMIVQDGLTFSDSIAVMEYPAAVTHSGEADRVADALGLKGALILANHGLVTAGASVEHATWWMMRLERCCEVQILAEAAGGAQELSAEIATATKGIMETEENSRQSMEPYMREIVTRFPEVLI